MNITGQWQGTAIYGKGYRKHTGKELYFEMDISQQEEQIKGTSTDTGGTGVSPHQASIAGTFTGNKISFHKQYARRHYYHKGGTKVDESRPGHIIEYSGMFDETKQRFSGEWIIKSKAYLFGLIPLKFTLSGTWNMEKK